MGSHANTSLGNLAITAHRNKNASGQELLDMASHALSASLLNDSCYDEPKGFRHRANKTDTSAAVGQKELTLLVQTMIAPPGQFCIDSVVNSLVKRLNDTQNLIGMTMRFEAKALAMVQQQKAKAQHTKSTN